MDSMSKRLALLVVLAWSSPVAAQHVYKCVNWQGAVTYQSERCSDRDRIDRVYDTNREIEVDGRVVRNFVPSTAANDPALSRRYGSPQNADGSYKSDSLCGVVTAATSGHRRYRNIESLAGDARLRSAHCNHTRGPGS
ncbi:DUF4124 domain-containing protein [Luteimonas fraxinea]|nr:DUF4124 domain-containing protein [Luteimonas fraxinea]